MSKCISRYGEYSEHEGIGEFCDWCGDCNHDAIRSNAKAEALRDAAGHMATTAERLGDHYLLPGDVSDWLNDRANQMEGNE